MVNNPRLKFKNRFLSIQKVEVADPWENLMTT